MFQRSFQLEVLASVTALGFCFVGSRYHQHACPERGSCSNCGGYGSFDSPSLRDPVRQILHDAAVVLWLQEHASRTAPWPAKACFVNDVTAASELVQYRRHGHASLRMW